MSIEAIIASMPADGFAASAVMEKLTLEGIKRPRNLSNILIKLGYYKSNYRWSKNETARARRVKYDTANNFHKRNKK